MGLYNRCLGLETGNPSAILRGRNEIFLDILLSCGDKKLYSVSSDRILKVWSVTGGEALENIPGGRVDQVCGSTWQTYSHRDEPVPP